MLSLSITGRPIVWNRHSGRLKHIVTTWVQTHKSVTTYRGGGYTLHSWSCIGPKWLVTAWTSRPNVSRRCFERIFSVSASYVSSTTVVQATQYQRCDQRLINRRRKTDTGTARRMLRGLRSAAKHPETVHWTCVRVDRSTSIKMPGSRTLVDGRTRSGPTLNSVDGSGCCRRMV